MAVTNVLTGIAVKDMDAAIARYEQVLGRPPDTRPMEGLAEWQFEQGGRIQVANDKDRAGSSIATFVVTNRDDQVTELETKGIAIEQTTTTEFFKTAILSDPDGNQIVFVEDLTKDS